jgi:hypothetical protein
MPDWKQINNMEAMVKALLGKDPTFTMPVPDIPAYGNMPSGLSGSVTKFPFGGPRFQGAYAIPGGGLSVGGHYQPNPWGADWGVKATYGQEF